VLEPASLLAGIILVSLSCYALLGGADYGGGVWDLLATGPSAKRQREVIARAIAPVWEANHVWLIVAVTLLFAGFPSAFARVGTFLHIPLLAALIGIVLRGAAFVFRAYGPDDPRHEWWWGRVFAIASSLTPLVLGTMVGALTEGRLPVSPGAEFAGTFVYPWLTPFSFSVGAFTLALFGYLAAVYLTLEADDGDVEAAFRIRAIGSGVLVGVLALAVILFAGPVPHLRALLLWSPWALPIQVAAGGCAIAALGALWMRQFARARIAAAAQVVLILWGWGFAQYPYLVRPDLTIALASAPRALVVDLLEVVVAGSLILVPALLYLFGIFGPRGARVARRPESL
jgi:cytochrome bd ubiquinol oxidase subunit II